MANQTVFFSVEAAGVGDLVDQLGLLRREAQQLQRDLRNATDPAGYTRLNRELENNRRAQSAVRSEITQTSRTAERQLTTVATSYADINQQLIDLRRQYRTLTSEERASPFGEQTIQSIQRLDQELRTIDASMGQFQRNVGNYPGGNRGIAAFGNLIQQTGGPLGNFIGQVEGFASPLTQMGESLGLTAAGAGAAAAGVAAVGIVAAKGVANAMEYETAFAQLSATLGVSGDEADMLKERISELQTITLQNGASIVSTSTQIADALTVVGSAAPQLLKNQAALQAVTKEVIVFSKSAGTDMAESARIVTGAMNLFGLESTEAARVINVLAAGEKEGSATTLEAADALEKAGGAANLAGVSIEETTAAIQLLAKDSLKGSEAGTQLRNVLLKLSTAEALPPDARKAFEKTGKDLQFFSDKTVPLVDKLQALKTISGDTAAMTKIFGTENINAAISLTKYADEFPNLTKAITDTDVAYDQAGVKQDTFAAKLENLSNKVNNLLTTIGQALLPLLSALADYWMGIFNAVSDVGEAFSDLGSEIGKTIGSTTTFGDILKTLTNAMITYMTGGLKALKFAIIGIGAAFVGVKAVVEGIPEAIGNTIYSAIANIQIFTLKAQAAFKDASNFISLGYATGGEEYYKKAAELEADLVKRQSTQKSLAAKFADASAQYIKESIDRDKQREVAAEQAVKAEEEALLLAEKLKADAEAEAERKKKAEEAAKKAAEEAKKRAEEERRNLVFLREELAKVEEKLKGYTDKSLIPTALLQSYNSLKNEIAGVEKQLAEMDAEAEKQRLRTIYVQFRAQADAMDALGDDIENRPLFVPVEIAPSSIQKIQGDLIDLQKMTAKEAYKSAKAVADAGKGDEKAKQEQDQKRIDQEKDIRDQIKEASIQLAQDASDAIFEIDAENNERRLENQLEQLDQQQAQQLALVEGNAIAEQQVMEQFAAQREQLEREAFERKKKMDIAQAIMNGALGVTSALSQVPAGFVMAALVAAQTAIQVATIAAQEFARGGLIQAADGTPRAESGVFVGPSHAGGGINARLSGRLVNVEGGEYYERLADGSSVVINKRSTARFMRALQSQAGANYPGKLQTLSRINELGGGVPLFATGGLIAPMGNASADRSGGMGMEILALAIDKMNSRVPVLTLQSFDTVNSRANQVKTLQGL